ncbi:MAG: enoyl-CoA hydratase-related protein [Pyrinomonadaceae bacterium]
MTNAYQNIKFSIDDRVARITFDRPPLNIFNIAMMREIGQALDDCVSHRDLAAVVFAAAPGTNAFSAGVAVEEHVDETVYQMLDSFHDIFRTLEQLAKPAIAVVNDLALGGGCELVAACDIVIATDRARFGQPEIKLGVFPPVAAILLPRIIGEKRARELIFTGDLIDAATALQLGLVNYVVPEAELERKTQEILDKLCELSAVALEMARRAMDIGNGATFDSTLAGVENLYLHELMRSEDAREGVKAFMEKRKAEWRHR